MASIQLKTTAPASVTTPPSGKVALFSNSSDSDKPYYKDSSGTSTTLTGATGATGPTGPGYAATSATSLATAGSGSKSFTTQSGLAYSVGARIRATSTGTGEWMEGVVTSYSSTTLVATMDKNSGTGTHADWNINLAGEPGAAYTDEQAQDAVGAMVDTSLVYVDATPLLTRAALTGDVTASQGSNATTIANDAVTYAKMQNVSAASKLLGRGSASGSGDPEEITLGSGLTMTGTTLSSSGGGGGSGSVILLGAYTASAQATLDITTRTASGQSGAIFQSDCDAYKIVIRHFIPATNSQALWLRVSVATVVDTGNNYNSHGYSFRAAGAVAVGAGQGVSKFEVSTEAASSTSARGGVNAEYMLYDPLSTSQDKAITGQANIYETSVPTMLGHIGVGGYVSASAIDGLQFLFASGNITSGTVYIYGLKNT